MSLLRFAIAIPLFQAAIAALTAMILGRVIVGRVIECLWAKYRTIPGGARHLGITDVKYLQGGTKKPADSGVDTDDALLSEANLNISRSFTSLLGALENTIYAAAWIFGLPEAIAVVLAIKAANQIKVWSEGKILGGSAFNIWLIGNLLNVIVSVVAAELIRLVCVVLANIL